MLWCVASLLGCRVKCIGENESIGLIYQKAWIPKRPEIDGFFLVCVVSFCCLSSNKGKAKMEGVRKMSSE